MSDLLLDHIPSAQRSSWEFLTQRQHLKKSSPFLSSMGAYLDIGDDVVLKFDLVGKCDELLVPNARCCVGRILSVSSQDNLQQQNIHFCTQPNLFYPNSTWIQINLWFEGFFENYIPPPSLNHIALPTEIVRSYLILWVPASFIKNIAFIFHHTDIINGKIPHTNGVKNAYFNRFIWNSDTPLTNVTLHPYFFAFPSSCVESYGERVWSVIERIQEALLKLMGCTGQHQKLNQRVRLHMSNRDWKIVKLRFDQATCCWFERTGSSTVHRYGNHLSQETVARKTTRKECILIENKEMFEQLIQAFGKCVVTTVRKRFPASKAIPPIQKLTSNDVLNSIICLNKVTTPNSDIEYRYRNDERGFEFRYEYETKKLFIYVRYEKTVASNEELYQFYGVHIPPPTAQQNQNERSLVNESFEAYESVFIVISAQGNIVKCRVIDDNDETNSIYVNGSEHNFEIDFVRTKVTEYLIN